MSRKIRQRINKFPADMKYSPNVVALQQELQRIKNQKPPLTRSRRVRRKVVGKASISKPVGSTLVARRSPPVSYGKTYEQKGPMFNNVKGFSVKHCEYLQDLKTDASGNLGVLAYPINCAQTDSFPWLGTIGANFEYYSIKTMRFEYRNVSGTAIPGEVGLAVTYDSVDPLLVNIQDFYNYIGARTSNLWSSCICPVLRQYESKSRLFCRPGAQPSNTDIRLYDVGVFQLIVSGGPANTVVGRLAVSYDVEFFVPKNPVVVVGANTLISEELTSAGSIATSNPLSDMGTIGGLASTQTSGSLNGQNPMVGDQKSFRLEPGLWEVGYEIYSIFSGSSNWSPVGVSSSGLIFNTSTAQVFAASTTFQTLTGTAWWIIRVLELTTFALAFAGTSVYSGGSFSLTSLNPNAVSGLPSLKMRWMKTQEDPVIVTPDDAKELESKTKGRSPSKTPGSRAKVVS